MKRTIITVMVLMTALSLSLPTMVQAAFKCARSGDIFYKFKVPRSCRGKNTGEKFSILTGKVVASAAGLGFDGLGIIPLTGTCISIKREVRISFLAPCLSGCRSVMVHAKGSKVNKASGVASTPPFDGHEPFALTPVPCSTVSALEAGGPLPKFLKAPAEGDPIPGIVRQ